MFVYWAACAQLLFLTGKLLNIGLAWNLFLAFLPLLFIEKALAAENIRWSRLWTFLWFIFFPNSLYPITSFIHLSVDTFYWVEGNYPLEEVVYDYDIYIWLKVFMIGVGFLFSMLVGLQSLYLFETNVQKKHSHKIGYIAVVLVSMLTGVAVFWGRFLRLNSWDIFFNPLQLLKEIFGSMEIFTLQFTIFFTIFALASYFLFRLFRKMAIASVSVNQETEKAISDK